MKKGLMLTLTVAALAIVFLFTVVHASGPADEMVMKSPVFETHKKGIVTFTHKKHNVDYKIPCADCHHVYKDGKNVWKDTDPVQKCAACHKEAKAPKGDKTPKAEKIVKYYYSAIHANCSGCHKDLKKAAKPTGPTTCKECHPAVPK